MQHPPPTLGARSLSHWTTREVLIIYFKEKKKGNFSGRFWLGVLHCPLRPPLLRLKHHGFSQMDRLTQSIRWIDFCFTTLNGCLNEQKLPVILKLPRNSTNVIWQCRRALHSNQWVLLLFLPVFSHTFWSLYHGEKSGYFPCGMSSLCLFYIPTTETIKTLKKNHQQKGEKVVYNQVGKWVKRWI